jgi:hypothetical protein
VLRRARLVGFPNGASTEDHPVTVSPSRVLASLLLGFVTACVGADSSKTASGLTDPSAIDLGHTKDSAITKTSVSTPPAAVTPAVSSNSTGAGLTGLGVASDDFTKYASTADLLNNITSNAGGSGSTVTALYHDGVDARLVELDKTVLYNGHPTMKYKQPGGVADTPKLGVYFSARRHIWYRFKVRFSPGFSTTGTLTNSSNAYKLIAWGWGGPDGSGRIEITNTTQYQLYENVQSGPSLIGGGKYLMAGNITTEWTGGGWYDYIVEVDHTQPTGIIRLWRAKDGQTPVYQGQMQETMNNGSMMPPLTNISVGLNFNQIRAPGQTQAVWWGQWEVIDGTQHPNPYGVSQ